MVECQDTKFGMARRLGYSILSIVRASSSMLYIDIAKLEENPAPNVAVGEAG